MVRLGYRAYDMSLVTNSFQHLFGNSSHIYPDLSSHHKTWWREQKERLGLPPQSSFSWPTSQSSIFLSFFICLWFSRSYQVLRDNTSKSKLFKRGFTGARRRRIVNEQSYVVAIILESPSRCINLIMFHCLIRISVSYSYSSLSSWLSTSWNPWYSYLSP